MEPNIWIREAPYGLEKSYKSIFTNKSIEFLIKIVNKFDSKLDKILIERKRRNNEIERNLWIPNFNNKSDKFDWKIEYLPERLRNRKIDLGDISPANTIHFVDALKSDVQGVQIDFDDGHCPTWRNTIKSYTNIRDAVNGSLQDVPADITEGPTMMFRPRALNMIEHNCLINGKEVNGAIFDFAFLMYFNGRKLYELGIGPYFYLSKIESPDETALWNEIFVYAQNELGIPQKTIKACVLIENILAAYQMTDILYNFKDHAIGLNFGMWDYCASIAAKFGDNPRMMFPDRRTYINTSKEFLEKFMRILIKTCHDHGAIVTSGMAAQILPSKMDNPKLRKELIESVKLSKGYEIDKGFDGILVHDFQLIPELNDLWFEKLGNKKNQLDKIPEVSDITAECLLKIPEGIVTLDGIRHNINVSLLFIYHWFCGNGIFYYNNAVEDSATAEISRLQLWQWIRHATVVDNNIIATPKFIYNELEIIVQKYLNDLCKTIADRKRMLSSKYLLIEILSTKNSIEYLTTFLNDNHKFRALHNKSDRLKAKL